MNLSGLSIVLLALICLTGIVQQWAGAGDYSWWRLGAVLLLLGWCYEWWHLRRWPITVQRVSAGALRLGRQESVDVCVRNDGSRSLSLNLVPGTPAEVDTDGAQRALVIAAGAERTLRFDLFAREPGNWSWQQLPAQMRGVLGLAWWKRPLVLDTHLAVVPDLAGVAGRASGPVRAGESSVSQGRGQELHHLRDYVRGDPRHTIDWKATARSQGLVTRVFNQEQHLEIMLLLDVGRTCRTQVDGLSQFGHYVNLAARFAQHAVQSGDHVGVVAASDRPQVAVPPRGGMQAVRSIRAALSAIEPDSRETDLLAAAQRIQQLVSKRALVIVLTDLYGQSLDGAYGRCLRFLNVRHFPVVVGMLGHDVSDLAAAAADSPHDVVTVLAASEYRSTLQRNAAAASRLGAHSIVCHPAELEARVLSDYRMLKLQRRV